MSVHPVVSNKIINKCLRHNVRTLKTRLKSSLASQVFYNVDEFLELDRETAILADVP